MINVESRIVNVIQTTQGDEISYFTLEGLLIGSFKGGTRQTPQVTETKKEKPAGGVVTPKTPQQVQKQRDREAESLQTAEGRLQHLKDDVA